MLNHLAEIWVKIYPYFAKDPVKFVLFLAIVVFLWKNENFLDYMQKVRAEDSEYYEHQIQSLETKLEKCHNEHIGDVRNFNHTLTKVGKHLDSIQGKR